MTASESDGPTLATGYLTMLNDHDPDLGDGFVVVDYTDHDHVAAYRREANRTFWSSFFTASPDSGRLTAYIVPDGELNVYPGPPHCCPATHADRFDDDLQAVATR
jgi:hypothetical protein